MNIGTALLVYVVLLFSLTVHEFAHAFMANKMGDPTARNMGRMTFNPIAHIDIVGTVIFPLIMLFTAVPLFGWAKPVPVNPYNLKNPRKDNLWIASAGPISNFIMAGILIIVYKNFASVAGFLPQAVAYPLGVMIFYGAILNAILGVFNFLPIPPLDGSRVVSGILPEELAEKYEMFEPFGFIILYALLFLGVLGLLISPVYAIIVKLMGM